MRITVLSGGIGGARFVRGLLAHLHDSGSVPAEVTVVVNTGDDLWLHGLKVCPDLDTVMYTLGGGIEEERGWGRAEEGWLVRAELAAYGVQPDWFALGDRDLATCLVRSSMLGAGYPLSAVTEALCQRWSPGARLLPMSDDRVETHVVIDADDEPSGQRVIHFQEYWVRLHASVPARAVRPIGIETSSPAPGVLAAIAECDALLVAPSNPVVSIGTILAVPGVREAVRQTGAPVVGLSPLVAGRPVRGMADAMLRAIGVEPTAAAVAAAYGSRRADGVLDGWLVDLADGESTAEVERHAITCRAIPLLMADVRSAARMARAALELAEVVRR